MPTTPSGTRILRMVKPFSSVRVSSVAPTGSGSGISARMPSAIAAIRASSRRKRSSMAAERCAAAASISARLAARMLFVAATSASAIAARARFLVGVSAVFTDFFARLTCSNRVWVGVIFSPLWFLLRGKGSLKSGVVGYEYPTYGSNLMQKQFQLGGNGNPIIAVDDHAFGFGRGQQRVQTA